MQEDEPIHEPEIKRHRLEDSSPSSPVPSAFTSNPENSYPRPIPLEAQNSYNMNEFTYVFNNTLTSLSAQMNQLIQKIDNFNEKYKNILNDYKNLSNQITILFQKSNELN